MIHKRFTTTHSADTHTHTTLSTHTPTEHRLLSHLEELLKLYPAYMGKTKLNGNSKTQTANLRELRHKHTHSYTHTHTHA